MRKLFTLTLVLILGVVSSAFGAAFVEDFDSLPANSWLDGSGENTLGNLPTGWYVVDSGSSFGHSTYPGYINNNASSGPDSSNALELGATDHGNGQVGWENAADIFDSAAIYGSVDFQFLGKLPAEVWANNRFILSLGRNIGTRVTFEFNANGTSQIQAAYLTNDDPTFYADNVAGLNTSGWNTLTFTIDNTSGSAGQTTVQLNGGTATVMPYSLWRSGVDATSSDDIEITVNGVIGLDNIHVSNVPVPEPSSLVLLALGGIALIRRRRR